MSPERPARACEADAVIRRIDASDWARLRDVRLRALATDPQAFLETLDHARKLPDVHWRERATPSETSATFVEERDGSFAAMVTVFVADDPATAYLVGMWVAPELRGGRHRGPARRAGARLGARASLRASRAVRGAGERPRSEAVREVRFRRDPATGAAPVRAQRRQPLLRIRAMTVERC
jgi:hypothetical protein